VGQEVQSLHEGIGDTTAGSLAQKFSVEDRAIPIAEEVQAARELLPSRSKLHSRGMDARNPFAGLTDYRFLRLLLISSNI